MWPLNKMDFQMIGRASTRNTILFSQQNTQLSPAANASSLSFKAADAFTYSREHAERIAKICDGCTVFVGCYELLQGKNKFVSFNQSRSSSGIILPQGSNDASCYIMCRSLVGNPWLQSRMQLFSALLVAPWSHFKNV